MKKNPKEEEKDWRIFRGTGESRPEALSDLLPPPPPWRTFERNTPPPFVPTETMIRAVNAALYLRRPLLLTGKPGTGKSSLVEAVATELNLGEVLRWPITSKSTLKSGIYEYDALGRLNERDSPPTAGIERFVRLGALGTALQVSTHTRALLIDEIDKSDLDLPNDLLHVFERGEYTIPELERATEEEARVRTAFTRDNKPELHYTEVVKGRIRCQQFPFVVLTSNGEREFPGPFLRRCIRLDITEPTEAELREIVRSHLGELTASHAAEIDALVKRFLSLKSEGDLATDQLLNAVYLACGLARHGRLLGKDGDEVIKRVFAHLTSTGFVSGI